MTVHFFSAPCQILQARAYMAARPKGWIPREGGGKAQSFKASQLHSPLSDLTVRADGERNRLHGNGSKAIPANAAPKHHSIKAPQHQSMYLAIRRLQTAGRCWLLAAEGRPQHQSPKAPKHPVRSYGPALYGRWREKKIPR